MNEFYFIYDERGGSFKNYAYVYHPKFHSSSMTDWSHYAKKDNKVENLRELTLKYRQIRKDVKEGRKKEALEQSMREGLITFKQAMYLAKSSDEDFVKDYYIILDQQIDKIKVNALISSIND